MPQNSPLKKMLGGSKRAPTKKFILTPVSKPTKGGKEGEMYQTPLQHFIANQPFTNPVNTNSQCFFQISWMTIDENLTQKSHIDSISKKTSKDVGINVNIFIHELVLYSMFCTLIVPNM